MKQKLNVFYGKAIITANKYDNFSFISASLKTLKKKEFE